MTPVAIGHPASRAWVAVQELAAAVARIHPYWQMAWPGDNSSVLSQARIVFTYPNSHEPGIPESKNIRQIGNSGLAGQGTMAER